MMPLLGTFLTITDEGVSTTIGYTRNLITDFMPILQIIVAVGIGLIVVVVLINAIRGH